VNLVGKQTLLNDVNGEFELESFGTKSDSIGDAY
jgi:hypothetical protein